MYYINIRTFYVLKGIKTNLFKCCAVFIRVSAYRNKKRHKTHTRGLLWRDRITRLTASYTSTTYGGEFYTILNLLATDFLFQILAHPVFKM